MYKIFIVEDDTTISGIMEENLTKWNYDVRVVEDFSRVYEEYADFQPDLVLLDIVLPMYDGYFWCQKIRQVSKVPIIFISSKNQNVDMIMALNMGADDFLQKPFSIDYLLVKVQTLIRRTYDYTNTATNLLQHGDAILNISDNTLSHKEEKIELTKNEFRILYLLMKQVGEITTRDEIMRSLWEHESFVDDNTLTVNINRLRKKLNDIGLEGFIVTKKGVGYMVK